MGVGRNERMSGYGRSLVCAALLWSGCAQVGDLSGGEKDVTPPKLVQADPPHGSVWFTADRIVLHFDERITLDQVRDRLLVSPPLDEMPEVQLVGPRSVRIRLKAPLKAATTYSFGIGEAVKDLTEGNIASGATYVVSTGAVLDSLLVRGRVIDAYDATPRKNVLVSIYDTADTTTLRTGRPAYATRTDANGHFTLDHVKDGRYRLYALLDQNANYRYDLPNEEVAFQAQVELCTPQDSIIAMPVLRMFREKGATQQVREARVLADRCWQLILARPASELALHDVAREGGSLHWSLEWGSQRDSVMLWPSDTTLLSEGRYALAVDGVVIDTLRYRPTARMPYFNGLSVVPEQAGDMARVRLRSARPLLEVDASRMTFIVDSVPTPFTVARDSSGQRDLLVLTDLPPGTHGTLTVLPKAVRDIYGGHNDTLRTRLGRAAEEEMGQLQVRLMPDSAHTGPFVLQLLDAQQRVVRSDVLTAAQPAVHWRDLKPGNHDLRLIKDDNGNGRWDTGVLDEGVQPEQVFTYVDKVNIRAAWDLLVEWTVR